MGTGEGMNDPRKDSPFFPGNAAIKHPHLLYADLISPTISFNPPVAVEPRKVSPTKKGRFVMEGEDVTNHYAFYPVISAGAYDPVTGKTSDGKPELYVNATKANAWQIRSHEDNIGDHMQLGNLVRINMFRRTAGFKVLKNGKPIKNQPDYIISAETGGKHYYALTKINALYGILANFPSKKSEPRLRIETRGVMTSNLAAASPPEPLADKSLSVRGKVHPLYDSFSISPLNEYMDWLKNPLVPLEEMMPEQIIVSLSGPSGMGKSTIQKELKKLFGSKASIAPTYTTRKKRKNEKQGIDIKTVSQAKFDKMKEAGDFTSANGTDLVFENYGDKYARRIQDLTATPIVIIDQSFDALKKMRAAEIADIFSIFILLDKPRKEWEYIIKSRGEPQWKVERRIKSGKKMMDNYKKMYFDLIIKNTTGELKKTVSKIHSKIISKMAITNPPKAHVVIDGSPKKDKKLRAVFSFSDGRKKTTHFGAKHYNDYTIHNDKRRRADYLTRHGKREDWEDFTTAGALSKWILWNKKTVKASFDHFLAVFSLTGELKVKTSQAGKIKHFNKKYDTVKNPPFPKMYLAKDSVFGTKENPMAPGYQSFSWISQDWRSVKVNNKGEIDYSEKCGAEGTQTKSGKPRLCLPRKVIQSLLKSESGKEVLRKQARKKAKAEKGERIPWHPRIKKLHAKLEKETVQDNPPMFSIRFEDIPKRSPPASKATMEELKVVMGFYQNKKVPDHLQNDAENIIPLFTNYMQGASLPFDQKVAKETISSLNPLIIQIKHYYARARPQEFAKHHGIDFNPKFVESAQTPEYPSGHSIQAYVLAHLLGIANPEHKKQLLSLADIVSQSRLDAGVHYPSSIIYSRDISPIIAKSFLYENPISPFQSGIAIIPRQEDQGRKVFYQPSMSKPEAEWMIFAVGYTSTTAAKTDLTKFTEAAKKHLSVPFEIKNKKRYNYALHKGAKIGTTHPKTGGPKSQGQAIQTRKSDEGETIFTADTLLGESWRNPLKTFNIKGHGMGNVIKGQLIRELEAKGHKISDTGNVYLEILGFNHPKKGAPDLIVSSPESMGPSHQLRAQRVALFLSENSELEIITDTVDDLDPIGNRLMYHGQNGVALAVFINKASDIHKHYKEISKSLADAIEISVNPPEGMLIQSYTLTIPVSFYDTSLAFFELEELGYEWKGENLERSWYSLRTRFGGKSTLHIRPHISYLYSAHQLSEKEQGLVRDDVIKVAEKIQAKKPKNNPAKVSSGHVPPEVANALSRVKEIRGGRIPPNIFAELKEGKTESFEKWFEEEKKRPRQQGQQGQGQQPRQQGQQGQQPRQQGQRPPQAQSKKVKNVFSIASRDLIKGLTGHKHPPNQWDNVGKKQQGKDQREKGKDQRKKGKDQRKKGNDRRPKKNPIEENRCSCGDLVWEKPDPKFGDSDYESYIRPPPGYCRCSSPGVGPGNPAKGHEADHTTREKFREYYSDGKPVAFPWEPGYKPPRNNPIKLNPIELDRDGVEYIEDFKMTMDKQEEIKKFKSAKLKGPIGSEALFLQLAEQVQDFGEASGWIKGDRLYFRPGARHLNEAAVSGYIMDGATAFFHTHPRVWEPSQTSPDDFKVYHGLFTIHGIQDHFTVMGDRIDWFHFAKSNRLKIEEVANVIIDFEKDVEEVFRDSEQEHIRETDGHAHLRDRTKDIVEGLNEQIPEYNVKFKCFTMSPEQIRTTKR